ncbi:MAG: FAD-dependent oxidoreductase [Chlamydiae bacterium]|nr:FAD-dependent oxidoreductase [Chlamydiota bacterium]MBI3276647.1 FAD-dependent oxidoreductase [Chlamydiota bacterium]
MNPTQTVTVIGGGLSGLSTATRLAEKGLRVSVFEKRNTLGGRASSTWDPETHELIDNCQHVLLSSSTQLIDFYRRLQIESKITFHDEFLFIEPGGQTSKLTPSKWPFPFHLLPSFFNLKFLAPKDKWAILKALILMAFTSKRQLTYLHSISFLDWLKQHHQTNLAIERFWRVIVVSALNEDLKRVSAYYAFKIFRETFLKNKTGHQMGIPNVPLSEIYSKPVIEYLERCHGKVFFQKKAEKINIENNRVKEIIFKDGSVVQSDFYVLALPFYELLEILPRQVIEQNNLDPLRNLESSPITGIHLFFEEPITEIESAMLLDRKIQWVFNKTRNFKKWVGKGQYLQLVISASREFIPLSKKEVLELVMKELEEFFPKARKVKLKRAIVFKELYATFSPTPQCDTFRPEQKTKIANLWMVGDWTKTDWPATMESAVLSGNLAAEDMMNL